MTTSITTSIKLAIAASFLFFATNMLAQQSGVSRPETLQDPIVVPAAPPAAVAVTLAAPPDEAIPTPAPEVVYGPYVPYVAPKSAAAAPTPELAVHERIVPVTPLVTPPPADAIDAGIVSRVPSSPFELAEGTLLKVTLKDTLSTGVSRAGDAFYATLAADVLKDGKVVLPAGAVLAGRITEVHEGHRIGGPASIHLRPYSVTLPDGTLYRINAQVIDSDLYHDVHVSSEGTLLRSDHALATISAIGLASGSSAVAGAMLGGPAGALIGAGVGAGIGTIVWLRQDHQQTLPEGTAIVFSLTVPMDIRPTVDHGTQHAAVFPAPAAPTASTDKPASY